MVIKTIYGIYGQKFIRPYMVSKTIYGPDHIWLPIYGRGFESYTGPDHIWSRPYMTTIYVFVLLLPYMVVFGPYMVHFSHTVYDSYDRI